MKIKLPKFRPPFVSRKTLEISQASEARYANLYAASQSQLAALRDDLAPKILSILDKIFKTEWKRHRPPVRRFCLVVEFDESVIHDAFIHGNNQRELEFMARYIGDMIVRDIRQINFARYVDEPEERGYRMPT